MRSVSVEPPPDPLAGMGLYRVCSMNEDGTWQEWRTWERCESRHFEGNRSWRCQRESGHEGQHSSLPGGRRWRR